MTTPPSAPSAATPDRPKSLPRNLRPPARPFPFPGGKIGLVMFLTTVGAVLYFGIVAWGRFGSAVKKVFATNTSSHYANRREFFVSRLQEIEKAGPGRVFAFSSTSIAPKKLKARIEKDALVLDASDAKGIMAAESEARAMDEFHPPGGNLTELTVRFVKPWDYGEIARVAGLLFERILDGSPEGVVDRQGNPLGEIVFDDL